MTLSGNTIGYLLNTVARKIDARFNDNFRTYGVTTEQWTVLKKLSLLPDGCSQKRIAVLTEKDPNTVKAIVDKLEKKGMLKRMPCLTDKRAFILMITEQGRSAVYGIAAEDDRFIRNVCKSLTEKDFEQLTKLLEKIHQDLQD